VGQQETSGPCSATAAAATAAKTTTAASRADDQEEPVGRKGSLAEAGTQSIPTSGARRNEGKARWSTSRRAEQGWVQSQDGPSS
jgi:hypothetical protein